MVHVISGIYSAIRKKAILPFKTTWMDLKSIMPNEISQTEKKQIFCYLNVESKKETEKPVETESRVVVTRGLGRGDWGDLGKGDKLATGG